MTRSEAMFEVAEIASTAIYQATAEREIPELFSWCEVFKNEALSQGKLVGTPFSEEFNLVNKHQMKGEKV